MKTLIILAFVGFLGAPLQAKEMKCEETHAKDSSSSHVDLKEDSDSSVSFWKPEAWYDGLGRD